MFVTFPQTILDRSNVSSSDYSLDSDLSRVRDTQRKAYYKNEEELKLVENDDNGVPSSLSSSENEDYSEPDTQSKEYRDRKARPHNRTGLMMTPNCDSECFTTDNDCDHVVFCLDLTKVGDYCAFPVLWWHH